MHGLGAVGGPGRPYFLVGEAEGILAGLSQSQEDRPEQLLSAKSASRRLP